MNVTGLQGLSAWLVYNKVANCLVFCREFIHEQENLAVEVGKILELDTLEDTQKAIAELALPKRTYKLPHECITSFKQSNQDKRKALLSEAIIYSDLSDDEIVRLLAMHNDGNGIPYSKLSVGNLTQEEMANMILDSLMQCANADVDLSLVSSDELEALEKGRVNVNAEATEILISNPNMGVGELLSLAIKKAISKVAGNG